MYIQSLSLHPYTIPLTTGTKRSGILIRINTESKCGWGDIAPLPNWSNETLDESISQLKNNLQKILKIDWTARTYLDEIASLRLFPSVSFGLESALFKILSTPSPCSVSSSALLMGSKEQILEQALIMQNKGYTSVKVKVSTLPVDDAKYVIDQLIVIFLLVRIDVNRAWSTNDSLKFFSQYPLDAFDYVEEPFANPKDLALFTHPLAVDESHPADLTLEELECLPTLKALIYKPTIQGGMANCLRLLEWANNKKIQFVLSSSFESDVGLMNIAAMAHHLSLTAPIGIGTYHYLGEFINGKPLEFSNSFVHIPEQIRPKMKYIHSC